MFNSKAVRTVQVLMGIIFFVFGLNGLLMFTMNKGFIPMPPPPAHMEIIMNGFMATKYLMPLVKLLEVVAGLLLLANQFASLALLLLAPIMVNILGLHLAVDPSGAPMAIILTILYLYLFASKWNDFKIIFKK